MRALSTALLALGVVQTAAASPTYPAIVQQEAAMDCTPPCTICHQTNDGGFGTVVTEFGLSQLDHGLLGGNSVDLLADTIAAADVAEDDSDGDGTSDLDELAAGFDPNPGDTSLCALTPVYGCFSTTNHAPAGLLGLVSLFVLGVRKRHGWNEVDRSSVRAG